MKRFLTYGLVAFLSVSLLASCGGSKAPADDGEKQAENGQETKEATLTVWTPQEDQSEDSGNWLQGRFDAFQEQHPEWKITFKTGVCPEGDARDMVGADPEASADVYMYANDQIPDLLSSNALSELGGSVVEEMKEKNSEVTVNTVKYEDSIYGVPFTANTWFLYYDTRVFSEEDVKNIDTMLQKGKVGFPLSNSWYFASFYVGNGCTLFGDDGSDAKAGIDFSGDKATEVTKYLVNLVKNSNFVDANGLDPSALSDGTINAYFSGTWDYASVVKALGEENVGIAAPPKYTLGDKEVQLKAFAGSKAIGVNPNTKNPEIAVAFAAFLGNEESQKAHYDLRNIIPTISFIDVTGNNLAKAQMDTMYFASIVQPLQADMGNYWTPAESMGKEIVSGTVNESNAAEKTEAMNESMNNASVK